MPIQFLADIGATVSFEFFANVLFAFEVLKFHGMYRMLQAYGMTLASSIEVSIPAPYELRGQLKSTQLTPNLHPIQRV